MDRLLIGAFYLTNFLRIDVDLKERDKTASRDGIMKKVISSFLLLAALGLDSTVLFWNSSAPRAANSTLRAKRFRQSFVRCRKLVEMNATDHVETNQ